MYLRVFLLFLLVSRHPSKNEEEKIVRDIYTVEIDRDLYCRDSLQPSCCYLSRDMFSVVAPAGHCPGSLALISVVVHPGAMSAMCTYWTCRVRMEYSLVIAHYFPVRSCPDIYPHVYDITTECLSVLLYVPPSNDVFSLALPKWEKKAPGDEEIGTGNIQCRIMFWSPFVSGSIAFERWWNASSITTKLGGDVDTMSLGPTRLLK